MDTRARYKAYLYDKDGSLVDVSEDKKTRSDAITAGREWLEDQEVGATVEISVEQNLIELENTLTVKVNK